VQADTYTGNLGWENWQDVCKDFDCKESIPDEVLAAYYDDEGDYGGYSYVAYRNGERYFTVTGAHCSCYGLEGQWEPEEYTKGQLIAALQKAHRYNAEKAVLSKLTS
jgi:hypothetical protein